MQETSSDLYPFYYLGTARCSVISHANLIDSEVRYSCGGMVVGRALAIEYGLEMSKRHGPANPTAQLYIS